MTMFLTKVWGFGEPVGPLQFSTLGWRENALRQLKPGDQVLLVGTTTEPTQPAQRGRLLGVMEPTSEPVMSLDYDLQPSEQDFVDGEYKWPVGLMNRRAWSLPDGPSLSAITPRKFSMDSAQGIVPLTPEEEARVRALRWDEALLLKPTAQAQERIARKHGGAKRSPPPATTMRTGVMHMRRAAAYTYAMEIKGARRVAFKIGWSFDYKQRAVQFNHAAMPDLGGLEYAPFRVHLWDTARQAYHMEQRLLGRLEKHRSTSNHQIIVGVTAKEIDAVWIQGVMGKL
ncbi:hypothetical protein [Bosea sp. (in: a-proteobacteria)]|uniref:hypothetical protein n=1 Tax=Bosea sp. (in: a-proteobacteria) TaxID=1871050 RepID=UPI003B3A5BD2